MIIPLSYDPIRDEELIKWLEQTKGTLSRSAYIRTLLNGIRLGYKTTSSSQNIPQTNNQFANSFIKQVKK